MAVVLCDRFKGGLQFKYALILSNQHPCLLPACPPQLPQALKGTGAILEVCQDWSWGCCGMTWWTKCTIPGHTRRKPRDFYKQELVARKLHLFLLPSEFLSKVWEEPAKQHNILTWHLRRQIQGKEVNLSVSSIEITLELSFFNEMNRNKAETKGD